MTALCGEIGSQLGALFSCTEQPPYTRIRTPFLYPDGDVIDVFAKPSDHVITLTDLGESLRWLRMQTPSPKRSPKQRKLIEDVCLTHGVELFSGMLTARATSHQELAFAVTSVAQAAMRVADVWFTLRTRSVQSVTDEIDEFLTERAIPHDRWVKLPGRSGRSWTIDFQTRTDARSSFVQVLSTGSRSAARGIAEHAIATWHDLSHMRAQQLVQFVSLIDDTSDVWAAEDFNLVESLSEVARWSRPDELEALLRAA
ncbi:MAG TPA: DUF1828 domain-containing protein [Polyangiaceae bacterium]|jgi:hypothetical protein|nr:DUF1828 domain-containing protein [Polyangiaceae bacterium]